jgi:glutamine amidotransferase
MSGNIVIVDYGMGNLNSIYKKFVQLKTNPIITSDPLLIKNADKIILPGVGHFGNAMKKLQSLNLIDTLNEAVLIHQKPILGICLGMQLMTNKSEEGNVNGLKWIDAEVIKFNIDNKLKYKIPHMGWNQITITKNSTLMKNIPELSEFYFVHAYHIKVNNKEDILNVTEYEYKFTSAIQNKNIFGVQYHPEKSHDIGDVLLKNFTTI